MSIIAVLMFLAMAATLAVLVTGVVGFIGGGSFNERYGNKLMRARIGFQFLALLLLALLFLTQG